MSRNVAVSIGLLLLLVGCGGTPKGVLSGKVTYKSAPVNGATLTLYPAKGQPILIPVAQDGTFHATGVPVGEYRVSLEGSAGYSGPPTQNMTKEQKEKFKDKIDAQQKDVPTIAFPDKYKDKEKSGLSVSVIKGETTKDFELVD
jgi:hypothetical protein